MAKKPENEKLISEKLQKELEKLHSKLKRIQEGHIDMAIRAGYAMDATRIAKNNFATISKNTCEHPEFGPVISSAYFQAVSMNQTLKDFDIVRTVHVTGMTTIAGSLMTTCSTSGSIVRAIDAGYSNRLDTPSFLRPESDSIYEKLKELSQPLANTYLEIEQVYYGTNADNSRGALPMMREAFNHFFAIVAPDEDVIVSELWEEKTDENNPYLVTRRERIRFAIANRIKNQEIAEALTNDIDLIVKSYKVLNRMHERDELNEESAREALFSVKHFLEEFATFLK